MDKLFNSEMTISNAGQVQQTQDNEVVLNEWLESRDRMAAILGNETGSMFWDTTRSIDQECGYPETSNLSTSDYQKLYDRNEIAARVVEVMPDACWQVEPQVYETKELDDVTEFETAWKELPKSLNSGSWLEAEQGNPVWEALEQLDILSGIGHYGILLIGIDDGLPLDKPAEFKTDTESKNGKKLKNLTYLRPLSESTAKIDTSDTNPTSVRFGLPTMYEVTLSGSSTGNDIQSTNKVKVHWSRILHYSDTGTHSHTPRLQTVYNRLYDLHKLYGGSAEMYWQGAFPGLSIETDPKLHDKKWTPEEKMSMAEQMMNYRARLQRYIHLKGSKVNSLAPQVVDPSKHIDKELEAICVYIICPKRVFMGSERGELSSSQDIKSWDKRVKKRQNRKLTPRMIGPFVDRLIMLGVLPVPASKAYTAEWPEIAEQAPTERAEIADKQTSALVKYVTGGVDSMISPEAYLVEVIGFSKEEAKGLIEEAEKVDNDNEGLDEQELAIKAKEEQDE